jgi:predicted nuclease of predicted toxin-antitoxin system
MPALCKPADWSSGASGVIVWIDAQLSPALARWITETFGLQAYAVRDLGLRDAKDTEIFQAARQAGAIVMSKDSDFAMLLERFGPPPQILWVTCGNTSNAHLTKILATSLSQALQLLDRGEQIVEITDKWKCTG